MGTLSLCAFRIAREFTSRSSRTRDLRKNLLAFAVHFISVVYVLLMRSNKPETAVYGSSIGLRYGCAHAHGDDDTMGLSTYYAACIYARTPLRTAEMWGKSNDITEFTRLKGRRLALCL